MAVRKLSEARRIDQRLKLRELQVLGAVVECGSMVKAAQQLGMSQPAISAVITNLESTLGVRLLDRSPRGIEPNLYSEALLKRSRVVFDELRQGLRDIEFLMDPSMGEVRVGCPENLAAGFVPAIVDRLSRLHPRAVVHVITAQTGTQEFRELRERQVDLMLGRLFKPTLDDDIRIQTLATDRFFVVASLESPWARRRKLSLIDLIDEPSISNPSDNLVGSYFADVFRRSGLDLPTRRVVSFSLDLRMHLLATGRYLTVLSRTVLEHNAQRWGLKDLPVNLQIPDMPIAVFTLKNRTISPLAKVFIDQAQELAKFVSKRHQ